MSAISLDCAGVYLLHFETKLGRAGHYIGYAETSILERCEEHEVTICTPPEPGETKWKKHGPGAKIMGVINYYQIKWVLARPWTSKDRAWERRLKQQKKAHYFCPVCAGHVAYRRMKG